MVIKMYFQYLLFDLDGTLTDPVEGITASVQYALRSFGIEEPDRSRLTPFIGPPLKDSFMQYYGFSEKQAEQAIVKYRERFSDRGIFENRIYDGIPQLLHKLKASGGTLAVASSKPQVFVEQILKYFSIEDAFDVIVGSELDGRRTSKEEVVEEALRQLYRTKPDRPQATGAVTDHGAAEEPASGTAAEAEADRGTGAAEALKEADRGTGAAAEALTEADRRKRTVMVGDRSFDIIGGKEHGLWTVGCAYGYAAQGELERAGADWIAANVAELLKILESGRICNESTQNM